MSDAPEINMGRLMRDAKEFPSAPAYLVVRMDPDRVTDVHFLVVYMPVDATNTDHLMYMGGVYWGCMELCHGWPNGAIRFRVNTPTGIFVPGDAICVSEAAIQRSQNNPATSLLQHLIGFVAYWPIQADWGHNGFVRGSTVDARAVAAADSMRWNLTNPRFRKMFPEFISLFKRTNIRVALTLPDKVPSLIPPEWHLLVDHEMLARPVAPPAVASSSTPRPVAPVVTAVVPMASPVAIGFVDGDRFIQEGKRAAPSEPERGSFVADLNALMPIASGMDMPDAQHVTWMRSATFDMDRLTSAAKRIRIAVEDLEARVLGEIVTYNMPALPDVAVIPDPPASLSPSMRDQYARMVHLETADETLSGGAMLCYPIWNIIELYMALTETVPRLTIVFASGSIRAYWMATHSQHFQCYDLDDMSTMLHDPRDSYDVRVIVHSEERLSDETAAALSIYRTVWFTSMKYSRHTQAAYGIWARARGSTLSRIDLARRTTVASFVNPDLDDRTSMRAVVVDVSDDVRHAYAAAVEGLPATIRQVAATCKAIAKTMRPIHLLLLTGRLPATPSADHLDAIPSAAVCAANLDSLGDAPECHNCRAVFSDGVYFDTCRHAVCTPCAGHLFRLRGMPFCGTPCPPGQRRYAIDDMRMAAAAPAADVVTKMTHIVAFVKKIMDTTTDRVAIVAKSRDAIDALHIALRPRATFIVIDDHLDPGQVRTFYDPSVRVVVTNIDKIAADFHHVAAFQHVVFTTPPVDYGLLYNVIHCFHGVDSRSNDARRTSVYLFAARGTVEEYLANLLVNEQRSPTREETIVHLPLVASEGRGGAQ